VTSQPHGSPAAEQVDDWDRHWDAYSKAAERNPAQRYRRMLVLNLLGAAGAPERLIDIGSGQGDLLRAAARLAAGVAAGVGDKRTG
jgi:cyclopropane fatty-acyl-phospholipid synthase-like methyltransferase